MNETSPSCVAPEDLGVGPVMVSLLTRIVIIIVIRIGVGISCRDGGGGHALHTMMIRTRVR